MLILEISLNHKVFSICFVFSYQLFFQLLGISFVLMIFHYSAQILENALFCWQNACLKNRLFCSKFYQQNLPKPSHSWRIEDPGDEVGGGPTRKPLVANLAFHSKYQEFIY